jgi:hypothetical protein
MRHRFAGCLYRAVTLGHTCMQRAEVCPRRFLWSVVKDDCKRAQQRLDKENAEAMSARLDAGGAKAAEKDPQELANLEDQLRSLQLAERNYCNMKMQNSIVYAEILQSMAHTMTLLGKVVPAAVRSGEAALVEKITQGNLVSAGQERKHDPPIPARDFVDS